MNIDPCPPQEYLQSIFNYDEDTGALIWKKSIGGPSSPGKIAGTSKDDYIVVMINRTPYQAHRLIWTIMTGNRLSDSEIDHKDNNGLNNRMSNLRISSRFLQNQNRRCRGCYFKKQSGKWVARIRFNKREIHIGSFDTPEEASAAYFAKRDELWGTYENPIEG